MVPKQIAHGLLPLLLAAGILPSGGATRVWTGAQNGLWSNPANWQDELIPVHLDSIEFPPDAGNRETQNDLPGREFGSITFTGGRYTLGGDKLFLRGGVTSIPGGSTNRIECDIFVGAPMSFVCFGYFNQLDFAGIIEVAYPLRLETSSWIKLSSEIKDTNHVGVTQSSSGKVSFGPRGKLKGTMIIERGLLELAGASEGNHVEGRLLVGDDAQGPGAVEARVVWGASDKLGDDTAIVVNKSGRLELMSFSEQAGPLRGAGMVSLQTGQLTVNTPGLHSEFGGDLRGTGTFRITGENGGLELSGHNTLTGLIEVAAGQLTLSGSVSNAAVRLLTHAGLRGNGVARSLTGTNAIVRPGPGTLRFLEYLTLDRTSTIAVVLDGPSAGSIQAGSINLGKAALALTYDGFGAESFFTLIAANANSGSRFHALPEGAWVVAGDPDAPGEFRLAYSGNGGHDVILERTGLFVPPTLGIRPRPTNGRIIEWPLAARGYSLERATTLNPPDWSSDGLPAPDATATGFFIIDNSAEGGRFYRLKR